MLTHLDFSNFKSWRRAEIELAPISLFFGPNSSGKSSILQFLLMLKQTKEATDRSLSLDLGGPYAALGTFTDVIHRHDDQGAVDWTLAWRTDEPIRIEDPSGKRNSWLAESDRISLESKIGLDRGSPVAHSLTYRLGDAAFSLTRKTTQSRKNAHELRAHGMAGFAFRREQGRAWDLPGPVKSYAFPDQARTYFQNSGFLADLETSFEAQMDRIAYLGPLREHPRREYTWSRTRPGDVGIKGERAIEAILSATAGKVIRNLRPKAHRQSFQEMIAYWLREMGLIHDFSMEEIGENTNLWRARLAVTDPGTSVLLTEVGFGVSQVLPVVTLLYYVPEGATVLLEQPELHLHPRAQAELADLLISVAQHRRVQVIVETHSEHLLLRLQRRVAEGTLNANDVRIYFCHIVAGRSVLDPLDLDLLGNISNWPPGFFGDAFGEVADAEKARLQRQTAA